MEEIEFVDFRAWIIQDIQWSITNFIHISPFIRRCSRSVCDEETNRIPLLMLPFFIFAILKQFLLRTPKCEQWEHSHTNWNLCLNLNPLPKKYRLIWLTVEEAKNWQKWKQCRLDSFHDVWNTNLPLFLK